MHDSKMIKRMKLSKWRRFTIQWQNLLNLEGEWKIERAQKQKELRNNAQRVSVTQFVNQVSSASNTYPEVCNAQTQTHGLVEEKMKKEGWGTIGMVVVWGRGVRRDREPSLCQERADRGPIQLSGSCSGRFSSSDMSLSSIDMGVSALSP